MCAALAISGSRPVGRSFAVYGHSGGPPPSVERCKILAMVYGGCDSAQYIRGFVYVTNVMWSVMMIIFGFGIVASRPAFDGTQIMYSGEFAAACSWVVENYIKPQMYVYARGDHRQINLCAFQLDYGGGMLFIKF